MASAAAGIEFFAWSVGVDPMAGQSAPPPRITTVPTTSDMTCGRRKQPAKECALADPLWSGDRHGTSIVGQSDDLPGPGPPLDERGDRVRGEIAVIDDRGDHDRGGRLLRALQPHDRWGARGTRGWHPHPRPTQHTAKLTGRPLELVGASAAVEEGDVPAEKPLADAASGHWDRARTRGPG